MKREHAWRILDYQSVRRSVPLAAVLERFKILSELKRIGRQHFGTCPIHNGTNRKQFVCDLDADVWRCFGDCDRGGGTLELVAELERVDIHHAAQLVASWFALQGGNPINQRTTGRRRAMSEGSKPDYKVFSAQKREGEKDFLTRIGSGWSFSTKDGRKGMNINLSALPLGERIVVFEAEDEEETDDAKNGKRKK